MECPDHAFNNAMRVIGWERAIGTYHEESIQDWFLPHRTFLQFWNTYYGVAHFVVTLGVFIVLFVRRPQVFPQHRNALAVTTAVAIVGFAFFPLMPPRLLDEPCPVQAPSGEVAFGGACIPSDLRGEDGFGFVDTLAEYGGPWSFDSEAMASISNQYAAMPSLHIGWSAWCVDRGVAVAAPTVEPHPVAAVPDRDAVLHRRDRQPLLDRRPRWTGGARHRHRRRLRSASLEHRPPRPSGGSAGNVVNMPASSQSSLRSASRGSRVASDSACCWNGSTSLPICAGSRRRSSPTWRARSATSSSTRSSKSSGHLGSNLGAVELSLALHRVFDSPTDAILWDTGHQAYVHKIVTGRRDRFDELRQAGGLSGYPSREESVHDYIENSHASTVLSYAYGMAVARAAGTDKHRHIVAVIGDGAMTGGIAYEALNNLGHSRRPVIIVLNDNGRSYAPTVSNLSANSQSRDPREDHPSLNSRIGERLASALTDIRLNPVYVRRQRRLEEFLHNLPVVGTPAERAVDALKAGVREFLQPPSFFEALGVRYVGPVDGHNIAELEQAFRNAIELSAEGPIVVHVLTQKGRGYSPAEDDDEKHLHDAPVFDPLTGPPKAVPTGYTQAFAEAIIKEAELEPRLVAITAAMAGPTGLLPFQEHCPDRFFDVGIAEQHAVTGAGRHGDGRAPPGRRDLLDVPVAGVGSGRVRRRAAPPPGGVLPRPRRHHRRRRTEPPRRVRHGAAVEGAGDAGARAVERRGAPPDAARRDASRRRRSGRDPLPEGHGTPRRRARGRVGHHGPPGA